MTMRALIIILLTSLFCGYAISAHNLAYRRPTHQSSNYHRRYARYAVDGNPRACSHTHHNVRPWWRVQLHRVNIITRVQITNIATRYGARLRNFRILVGNNPNPNHRDNRVCISGARMKPHQTKTFFCRGRVAGLYVFIQIMRREYLELCNVKVFADPFNYALRKRTRQISTGWGGPSSHAVDGNRNGHYGGRSCTHTHGNYMSWWEVYLGKSVTVTSVEITNRVLAWNRLRGFHIFVGPKVCAYVGHFGRGRRKINCFRPVSGTYVRIQIWRRHEYLSLCEVRVFSESVNLARRKPTRQSSECCHGRSSLAVDGVRNTNYNAWSCTATRHGFNQWWSVDLQQNVVVTHVMVTNRGDCCWGRLRSFEVWVGRHSNYWRRNQVQSCRSNNQIGRGQTVAVECLHRRYGRFVFIRLARRDLLTLCEVEVYSLVGFQRRRRIKRRINPHTLARRWAPLVYLPRGEPFFPSSVNFFLRHVKMVNRHGGYVRQPRTLNERNLPAGGSGYFLTTKQRLRCPACTNIPMLRGQRNLRHVPVYTFVRQTNRRTLDLFYYFFYPYNRGKRACIGIKFNNACAGICRWFGRCICPRFNGCAGYSNYFGNHVGDWEHVSVRLVNNRPFQMYVGAHNFGGIYRWNGRVFRGAKDSVRLHGGRPVIYSALGSHGSWARPGRHVYKRICNGDQLADVVNRGHVWRTWQNLHIINFRKNRFHYRGRDTFLRFDGDWGNKEAGCKYKKIATVCVLNGGPSSLNQRGALQNSRVLSDEIQSDKTLSFDIANNMGEVENIVDNWKGKLSLEDVSMRVDMKNDDEASMDEDNEDEEDDKDDNEEEDGLIEKRFIRFRRRFIRRRIRIRIPIPKPRIPRIPWSRVKNYFKNKAKSLLKKLCPSK